MVLAYPGLEAHSREAMACDYFLDSLGDSSFKLKICERNPATLDEALKMAMTLYVWEKGASRNNVENVRRKPDETRNKNEDRGKSKNARSLGVNDGSTVKTLTQNWEA